MWQSLCIPFHLYIRIVKEHVLWYNKTRGLVKKCPSRLQFGKYDQWKFSMANGLMLVQTKQKISVPDLHRQAQGICEKILDMLSVKLSEYIICCLISDGSICSIILSRTEKFYPAATSMMFP